MTIRTLTPPSDRPAAAMRRSRRDLVAAHELLARGRRPGAAVRRQQLPDAAVPDLRAALRLRVRRGDAALRRLRGGADPDPAAARPRGRPGRPAPAARRRHRDHRRQLGRLRRRAEPRLAVRRRDHLRHRRRPGDVVRRRRHPRAAPEAARRRRRAGRVGRRRRRAHPRPARERAPRVGRRRGRRCRPTCSTSCWPRCSPPRSCASPRPDPAVDPEACGPRTPIIHVPADIRPSFVATAVAGAASFMVVGWVFGLSPSYLHEELHIHITQPVVAGLFAALVVLTNGVTQLVLRRHHSRVALQVSLVGVASAWALMAASTLVNSLAVAIVGGVVAGAGAGVAQMNAMATIQRIAPTHARGGVTSAYFTLCYVAMSVPVISPASAADRFGLGVVTGLVLRRSRTRRRRRVLARSPRGGRPRRRRRGRIRSRRRRAGTDPRTGARRRELLTAPTELLRSGTLREWSGSSDRRR